MNLMSRFWEKISSTAESAVESVKETASDGADAVEDAAESAYDAVGDAVEAVSDGAEAVYDAAGDAAESAYEAVEEGAEAAYDAAGDAAEAVEEDAEAAYDADEEGAEAAYDAAEAVEEDAEAVYDAAGDALGDAVDAVEDAVETVYDAVSDAAEAVEEEARYDDVSETCKDVAEGVDDVLDSDAAEAVEEEARYDDVSETCKDVAEGVDDVFDSVFGESEEELRTRAKNIDAGTKQFGSGSGKFKDLKGVENLNPRQKQIFDEKLKQALERDPRAKRGELSEAELKEIAQQAAEVSEKLAKTPLKKEVNDLSMKSATLKDNIVKLQNDGWTIKEGIAGKGSFATRSTKTITIDPSEDTKTTVQGLSHETGHADYPKPPDPSVADDSPSVAKGREYIRKVVENSLLDEGQAQVIACTTATELEAAGETGIEIPGGHSAEYKAVYKKIADGTLTKEAGRKEMAKIMATETTSNTSENYIQYYAKAARENWNKAHPEAQIPLTDPVTIFP